MLLLACLLFNAALAADGSELVEVVRRPWVVVAGVTANVLMPLGFLVLVAIALRWWHSAAEAQSLVVGLTVVAAMPVAGSSTAWSQNTRGSTALSLGLVVLSTLLSPLTTPLTFAAIGPLTSSDAAGSIASLSAQGTAAFLIACVALPSLAGLATRRALGVDRAAGSKRWLKLANSLVLLLLCYANASAALPGIVAAPDWDFLVLAGAAVISLCVVCFVAGWVLGRLLNVSEPQRRSLTFALGMNNNGSGMVLACASLAGLPNALFPVLAYNLVQHLVAGAVSRFFTLQEQRRHADG
jgi:BASS family bile acid:Na+ symporter